jgi:hypothetical protein
MWSVMTDAFRGLYRTIDGAYVANGEMGFHVPEANYHAFRYEPAFDKLPWKENYRPRADNDSGHATQ